ncbi:hypothetical protein [Cytobacillus firmus]|uniref:hypothetical protein n=1 Tax=Cytobacillus firmus TaxID=1399 RepID=UPI0018CEBE41|nr:hypothetical protein [Cytobacillus firmus]
MKAKANQELRQQIRESGFYAWQVAEKIGIHENTFFRILRKDLNDQERHLVIEALEQLSLESVTTADLRKCLTKKQNGGV